MVNDVNLAKIYDCVAKGQTLTTKCLNEFGFNSVDLTNLVKDGTLVRVKRGQYELPKTTDLYTLAKELLENDQKDEAIEIFKKCIQSNPDNFDAYLELMLIYIKDENFNEVFVYFEYLYSMDNDSIRRNCKFYLYLLNEITELPVKYRNLVINSNYSDFMVLDNASTISLNNKIRLSCYNRKFGLASMQLNRRLNELDEISVNDQVIYELLDRIINPNIINRNDIVKMIRERKYEDIIEGLRKKSNICGLDRSETYILVLAEDLLNILVTGKIPSIGKGVADNIFSAIDIKNYELALTFSNAKGSINMLLEDIIDEIRIIKEDNEIKNTVNGLDEEAINGIATTVERLKAKLNPTDVFADFISSIINGNLDRAFNVLEDYLYSIDKIEYEFLIIDLVKICLKTGDYNFTEPYHILMAISRDEYQYNLSNYIEKFYQKLIAKDFDCAKIYLDIISKSYKLNQECIFVVELEQILKHDEQVESERQRIAKEKDATLEEPKIVRNAIAKEKGQYYGIECVPKIAELVSNGSKIDDAMLLFSLSSEEKSLVYLIFAREYYSLGYDMMGDQLMKKVSKSKNKTKRVTSLFNEIIRNKRFYANRVAAKDKCLIFTNEKNISS